MHPGMHPIDDDLVRRLIAGQFPQWAGLALRRLRSGGTVNAMYRLGDDLVVRLPLVQGGVSDVAMERTWLPRLAPLLPTAIPEVRGAGEPAEGYPWPWSVYGWLAGQTPEPGALSEPARLAEDLAAFVAAMRGITLPGAPQAHRGGPSPRSIRRLARRSRNCAGSRRRASTAMPPSRCGRRHCARRAGTGRQCGCMRISCRGTCWWMAAG
jgi:aminoglycoside phosphotransferase (APT) family kinase protein